MDYESKKARKGIRLASSYKRNKLESENRQKISGISYNIISYDRRNFGLEKITQNVVGDFLKLVGINASIQTLDCKDNDKLVSEWQALGVYENDDGAFSSRLLMLYHNVASRLSPEKTINKKIFVTNQNIGKWIGLNFGAIAIISSSEIIENDLDTFATAVFHELGHMHEIPSLTRTNVGKYESDICDAKIISMEHRMKGRNAIFECIGEHCLNLDCSMRQRLCFENWTLDLTKQRLKIGRPYCDKCISDLKAFFI